MSVRAFGLAEGQEILEIGLACPSGLAAKIITYGAVTRDLVVPAPGGLQRVVLGCDTIEDYVERSPYFGAVVGRYANRIAHARFELDGRVHGLDRNEGENHLHGGSQGFGVRPWTLVAHDERSCVLALHSRDGDMGYPGDLVATAKFRLIEPATLRMVLEAFAEAPTPVNLVPHHYFNLDGAADIGDHELRLSATRHTPVGDRDIPTGEIAPVADTAYDFRAFRRLGRSGETGLRLDRNYVLDDVEASIVGEGALSHAATLRSGKSRLALDVWTTEPGLQVYDGHKIKPETPGLDGARYGPNAGLCLEPQRFPDGPNRPHFPPSVLLPGTVSRQVSEFRFRPTD